MKLIDHNRFKNTIRTMYSINIRNKYSIRLYNVKTIKSITQKMTTKKDQSIIAVQNVEAL